jgi:hypothetical protein
MQDLSLKSSSEKSDPSFFPLSYPSARNQPPDGFPFCPRSCMAICCICCLRMKSHEHIQIVLGASRPAFSRLSLENPKCQHLSVLSGSLSNPFQLFQRLQFVDGWNGQFINHHILQHPRLFPRRKPRLTSFGEKSDIGRVPELQVAWTLQEPLCPNRTAECFVLFARTMSHSARVWSVVSVSRISICSGPSNECDNLHLDSTAPMYRHSPVIFGAAKPGVTKAVRFIFVGHRGDVGDVRKELPNSHYGCFMLCSQDINGYRSEQSTYSVSFLNADTS